ncbi:exostosin-like glycosyltransferase [Micractinium conductrix]|uniref:Exostosin-like glycosyltransferase n=1 Tax=Micractinium conductrix TaxID=554055 RepID=A0A2P6VM21_9CHLO|nr:exostosin-like glycosyltransferase [Micractinium conductrix]|eukprot:PSC75138.1 exostosin-like glycosyltransferase [Micractinium conductrix]
MLRQAARGLLQRTGAGRSLTSSAARLQEATEQSKEEFLKRFAPHQGMLNPPAFPSDYLPKTEAPAEGAALPDKLAFNFFVPHQTVCQSEKVDLVLVPAVTGDFGVMPGHVPTVAQLRPGVVTIHKELDKEVQKFFVSGGFAFVHADSTADVCAVEAVPVGDLDIDAVRAGLQEYTAKLAALQGKGDDYEVAAAQVGVEVYSAMNAAIGASPVPMGRGRSRSRSRSSSRSRDRHRQRRSYSRSRSRDREAERSPRAAKKSRQRNLRKHRPELDDDLRQQQQDNRQRELELEAAEEAELAARVEAAVQARLAEAVESPEFAARVAARLKEERARLEERVSRQLALERAQLLERKRREDAERRRQEEEMARILEENRRKVEEAQRKAAEAAAAEQGQARPAPARRKQEATHWSWERDFTDVLEIGKGKDTLIYSAHCPKLGGRRVAVKVYDKTKVQATKYRAIKREIAMMMFFQRKRLPSVVEYYGAFHDEAHLFIVMEYCGGGDLLEKLLRDKKAMNERRVAQEVALPCLSILKTMHEMRIIHRDIKLENIFIDDAGKVKLGDFGLTMSMRQESAISPVGTVEYMAPEVVALPPVDLVISGQIKATDIPPTNEKVDIWALGVTIYELVTGRLPFEGKDKPEIKRNITANNLAALPSFLTPQCQSFIKAMLTYGVDERPSCAQLLAHPYITMYCAPPAPKPQQGTLAHVVALHAYSPGAGGRVPAPPPDEMRSPRTPGGSHVPVTVSRNAAATTAQHSPTILAQSGYGTRQDPFASPLGRHEGGGGGGGAGSVPRKIAFDFFSPTAEPAPLPGDTKGGAREAAGEPRGLVHHGANVQAVEPEGQTLSVLSDRKRGGSFSGGMKALRKLFTRRGSHAGQHIRLDEEERLQNSFTRPHGVCGEHGTCMCPFGRLGEACEIDHLAPCRQFPDGEPICGRAATKSCECFRRCREYFCPKDSGGREWCHGVVPHLDRGCYEWEGVPPDEQYSRVPEPEEEAKVKCYDSYDKEKAKEIPCSEAMKYQGPDISLPLSRCPNECNKRGYCLTWKGQPEDAAGQCSCYRSYTGGSCETQDNYCFNKCNGRGDCQDVFCKCEPPYFSYDCSRSKSYPANYSLPSPVNFKIYMYELSTQLAYENMPHVGFHDHDKNYVAYEAFTEQFLTSAVRTEDPSEANLFYIPEFIYSYTGNGNPGNEHMHLLIDHIKHKYPYWNRTNGLDHFFWETNDRGGCLLLEEGQNPIKLVHWGMTSTPEHHSPTFPHSGHPTYGCTNLLRDIVTSPYTEQDTTWIINTMKPTLDKLVKMKKRYLFFAGSLILDMPEYSGNSRQILYNLTQEWNDPEFNLVKGGVGGEYEDMLRTSRFCFTPYGWGYGMRLTSAMMAGCVPIIVQEHVAQPFEDVLPYEAFSIRLSNSDLPHLRETLKGLSEEEYRRLLQGTLQYAYAFSWNPEISGKAFDYTIASLRRRHLNFKAMYYPAVWPEDAGNRHAVV